jgi:O-antigen/teichoic acid export membrane protein
MKDNNKNKAVEASAFVIIGFGMSQFLRLLGNLLLTRLLVPEMFGIMAIANVFLLGLQLFSDIGTGPGIIKSNRSSDPVFLNSAWSLQVIRGAILTTISLILAWPVSIIYKEPKLLLLLPVISLETLLRGLESTSLITMSKELQQKKLIIIELAIQMVNLTLMALLAYFTKSIWSLVIGTLFGSLIRTVWSHLLNSAHPNKFILEKAAMHELLTFGKWIFLSTAMMFLATQVDRIILGKFLAMAVFGIYNIALTFAELPKKIIERLGEQVVFPLITKYSHLPREQMRAKIKQPRKWALLALAIFLAAFGCFGDYIIRILYDQRYAEAGWMLPLLAFGMWPFILVSTIDRSLYSIGKPQYSAIGNMAKTVYMLIGIPLSYSFGGVFGAVLAVAINDLPMYVYVNYGLRKEKLSLIKQDMWATLLLLSATFLLLLFRALVGIGLPGAAVFPR